MTTIRAIIFEDGGKWVGQCLEYDIAAQADDLDTLRSRLLATIQAEAMAGVEFHGEPFKGIGPAPQHFHELWERKRTHFNTSSSIDGDQPLIVEQTVAA